MSNEFKTKNGFTTAPWGLESYVKAGNSRKGKKFGLALALSGDTLVVGNKYDDSNFSSINHDEVLNNDNGSFESGAVFVFRRASNNTWAHEAYIKAPNNGVGDHFGSAVAVDGNFLVVGAPNEDSNLNTNLYGSTSFNNGKANSGAVYVFKRTGTTWEFEAYLKAGNSDTEDEFGLRLALSGDTLAVGVPGEDSDLNTITNNQNMPTSNNNKNKSGAVYVFKRSENNVSGILWTPEAFIKAGNSDEFDFFGESLALSGDTLAVGAWGEDSNQNWISNGNETSSNNSFCETVGDHQEDYKNCFGYWDPDFYRDQGYDSSGAVYVYKRASSEWAQEAYIKAINSDLSSSPSYPSGNFGHNLILSGDTLVVSNKYENSNQSTITNDNETASSNKSSSSSGAVYVYKRSGNNWAQEAYIKAANNDSKDFFGHSISISGDYLAVGAHWEDSDQKKITFGTTASSDNSYFWSGAVYLFKRTGSSWSQEAYIKAENNDGGDEFGSAVAISGNLLAVGAPGESSSQKIIDNSGSASSDNSLNESGAVYVYKIQ